MQYKFRHMFTGVLFFIFVVSGAVIFTGARASAQVTFTNDEAQFFADNPGLLVQNFNSGIVPPGFCDTPLDSNSTDCFPPGALIPGVVYDDAPNHEFLDLFGVNYFGFSGNPSIALGPDDRSETLDIVFKKGGVSAAGVSPGCFLSTGVCQRTATISVYGEGDTLLGFTTVDVSSHFDDFVGIESEVPIAKISVAGPPVTPNSGFHAIDELVFSPGLLTPIPTLSGWGMIAAAGGLMLVGVFFAVRKRLQASNEFDN